MRTILFLVSAFILMMAASSAFGQHSNNEAQKTENKADTLEFTVYGMDCPGCEGGLEKQVNKIESVNSSEANWRKQLLQVVLEPDAKLDINTLEKRVKKANFTLDKKAIKEEE